MIIYRYKQAITLVPALSEKEAVNRYIMETDGNEVCEAEFEIFIPQEDAMKIFRLAFMLNTIDQYNHKDIEVIVMAYTKQLGYELSEKELWDAILKWAERLAEFDEEEIEDWIN